MTSRRIQFLFVVVVLFILSLASGMGQPIGRSAAVLTTTSIPTIWAFEGCWEPNLFSTCRDVFRDEQGNYWICRNCGTTGNPTPGKCSPTSLAALDRGFWCS